MTYDFLYENLTFPYKNLNFLYGLYEIFSTKHVNDFLYDFLNDT